MDHVRNATRRAEAVQDAMWNDALSDRWCNDGSSRLSETHPRWRSSPPDCSGNRDRQGLTLKKKPVTPVLPASQSGAKTCRSCLDSYKCLLTSVTTLLTWFCWIGWRVEAVDIHCSPATQVRCPVGVRAWPRFGNFQQVLHLVLLVVAILGYVGRVDIHTARRVMILPASTYLHRCLWRCSSNTNHRTAHAAVPGGTSSKKNSYSELYWLLSKCGIANLVTASRKRETWPISKERGANAAGRRLNGRP
jgi:hypothetical protein